MNVLLVDIQFILNAEETSQIKERLRYSLARFEHRINGVTVHVCLNEDFKIVTCTINVNLEGVGVVSVRRTGHDSAEAMNNSLEAIESKIAYRVDWRGRLNSDTCSTWLNSVAQPVQQILSLMIRRDQKGCDLAKPNKSDLLPSITRDAQTDLN